MQRIRLTKSLLTELTRCQRSFVMSLFWHGLSNDSLRQNGGGFATEETNDVYDFRREMMYNSSALADSIAIAGGITAIDCSTRDVQEKIDLTWQALTSGDEVVIADGLLDGGSYIVPFSVLYVRPDGLWEVYYQSTRSYDMDNAKTRHKSLTSMYSDAAPLMYVLANCYPAQVARFAVIAANKRYLSPYPTTEGDVKVDPDEALFCVDLDIFTDNIANYIGCENPMDIVQDLQMKLSENPFWIPDAQMGAQCNKPYECPFHEYCKREMEQNMPTSVFFFLPSNDAKMLEKSGIYTMDDLLQLSYSYPSLEDIPYSDNPNKTYTLTDITLRELRAYESALMNVERNVRELLA